MSRITADLTEEDARPYFLWDETLTVREFRERLASASRPERLRLLCKLLREARDDHVWLFTTPEQVALCLPEIEKGLGRRRAFWRYLIDGWRDDGLL